jgi:hypothetical protein
MGPTETVVILKREKPIRVYSSVWIEEGRPKWWFNCNPTDTEIIMNSHTSDLISLYKFHFNYRSSVRYFRFL